MPRHRQRVALTAPERDALLQADRTGLRPGWDARALEWFAAAASAGLAGLCVLALIALAPTVLGGVPAQIALALPLLACVVFGAAWASLRPRWQRWRSGAGPEQALGPAWRDAQAGWAWQEDYAFQQAARLRDPATGAAIYLLRVDAQRCLVVHDEAGFQLYEHGGDAANSRFRPTRTAVLRRGPRSQRALSLRWTGPALADGELEEWRGPMPEWSLKDRVWTVRWQGASAVD